MATYYINASTGNDSTGNGTSGNPWKTISKAYAAVSSGDTIYCQNAAATYTFTTLNVYLGINITGQSAAGVVFDSGGGANYWSLGQPGGASITVVVSNITFQNNVSGNPIWLNKTGSASTFKFTGCIFTNLTCNNGCIFLGNANDCASNLTLIACLFYGNLSSGSIYTCIIRNMSSMVQVTFIGCTIYASSLFSLWTYNCSCPLALTNNIFYSTTSQTANAFSSPTYSGSNNLFYNWTSTPSLANQLSSDPLFVNASGNNFNLRPTSPCINAGSIV